MQIDKENGGSDRSGKTWRGCLFCKAGKERNAIQELRVCAPEMRAVAPVKLRARRVGGVTRAERVSLIPGYIFFEIDTLDLPFRLTKLENVLKLLTYTNGDWQLSGYDDQFARTMFENNGEIGFSKAVFDEGNRIRIIDGFLKDYEGNITRVNRRARTAEVCVEFQGKKIYMWFGYELMERRDTG